MNTIHCPKCGTQLLFGDSIDLNFTKDCVENVESYWCEECCQGYEVKSYYRLDKKAIQIREDN